MSLYLARLRPLSHRGKRARDGAMKHFWRHPPRGLGDWASEPEEHLAGCIAHRFYSTVFGVQCPCGSREMRAEVGQIADTFIGPLVATCNACNTKRVIFNRHLHGREPEMNRKLDERDDSAELDREDGVRNVALGCPRCDRAVLDLAVRYVYGENLPMKGDRRQDLFRAFAAYARCPTCTRVFRIGDLETSA